MKVIPILCFLFTISCTAKAQVYSTSDLGVAEEYILLKINTIRKKGCTCEGKKYKPVNALKWNSTLEKSAYMHAKSMEENNYFSHFSLDGKDIGQRLDDVGYKWQYAGENLAEGQKSFDEALHDWMESGTHCKMIMHPHMKEMAISKYGSYWVNHFGAIMPKKTKRIGRRYSEGD